MDITIKKKIEIEISKYFKSDNFDDVFNFFEQVINYPISEYNYKGFSQNMNSVLEELFLNNSYTKTYFKDFNNLLEKYLRILLYIISRDEYYELDKQAKSNNPQGISSFAKQLGYKKPKIPTERYYDKFVFNDNEEKIIDSVINIKNYDSHYETLKTDEELIYERNRMMASYLLFTRANLNYIKQAENIVQHNNSTFNTKKLNPYIIDLCLQYMINFNEIEDMKSIDILIIGKNDSGFIHNEYDSNFILKRKTTPIIDGFGGDEINYYFKQNDNISGEYISENKEVTKSDYTVVYNASGLLSKYMHSTQLEITITTINYDTDGSFEIMKTRKCKKCNNEVTSGNEEYIEKGMLKASFDRFGRFTKIKYAHDNSLDSYFNYGTNNILESIVEDDNATIHQTRVFHSKLCFRMRNKAYSKIYDENGRLVCFGHNDAANRIEY